MRKFMLSAVLALTVLGATAVSSEARPWRRWYGGGYYGGYYGAPYYNYYGGGMYYGGMPYRAFGPGYGYYGSGWWW